MIQRRYNFEGANLAERCLHNEASKAGANPTSGTRFSADGARVNYTSYVTWLKALPGKPVFVGYPASYDFMFVYWYLMRFTGESPFSHSALDIKTFAIRVA